jgi:hypothetical protein
MQNDQPEERLNFENILRWIIALAFYFRFLSAPSFIYGCKLSLMLLGLNQAWLAIKPFFMKAKATMGWLADDGFQNFLRDCIVYTCQILWISFVSFPYPLPIITCLLTWCSC